MNKAVGRRVRRLRLDQDLTQAQLAKKANVTANTIRGLEKGTLNTRWPNIQRIAKALKTTPEAIVQGDEPTQLTDPLLAGLNREDFLIARAYHDATTTLRQRVAGLLRDGEPERVAVISKRLQALTPEDLTAIEGLVGTLEHAHEEIRSRKPVQS